LFAGRCGYALAAAVTIDVINPQSGALLTPVGAELRGADGSSFPILKGVPRICEPDNYAENFGKQWNLFSRTQLDDRDAGQTLSERRFFAESGWTAEELDGLDILEVGSGAGRFSRAILTQTKGRLWSVDYSTAVEANMAENGGLAPDRFRLFQASVYDLPFPDGSFDRVFCFGVLQHTPDFEKSVAALIAKAKPGGEIAVDFYARRHALSTVSAKYMLRPLTRRMPHDRLLKLIDSNLGWMMATSDLLTRVGLGVFTRFLPLVDLRLFPKNLTREQRREWALLDTFDMFSPEYDQPQRIADVAAMFERHGARVSFAGYVDLDGSPSAVVRGEKL
jgi:SAM-dependent methyltransferase